MPPRKGKSLGSTNQVPAYPSSTAVQREPVGSAKTAEFTLLEKCANEQSCNQQQIDDIAERISALIGRLQGHSVGCGTEGDSGEMKSIGVLGEHQAALKLEGQRLGEIQCDLAVLESLL